MRKTILFLQLMLLMSFAANAQEQKDNQSDKYWIEDAKSHIDETKMEIVHYKDQANYYRINKETGEVWILRGDKAYVVEIENTANNITYPGKTNFQLIVGEFSVYLLNINTGETWHLKMTKPFKYSSHRFVIVNHN